MIRHPLPLTLLGALLGHVFGIWTFLNSGIGQFGAMLARGAGQSDFGIFVRLFVTTLTEPNLATYDPRLTIGLGAGLGLLLGLILRSPSNSAPSSGEPADGLSGRRPEDSSLLPDALDARTDANSQEVAPGAPQPPPHRPGYRPKHDLNVVLAVGLAIGGTLIWVLATGPASGQRTEPSEDLEQRRGPTMDLRFAVEGEYFSFLSEDRDLFIKGTVRNFGSESYVDFDCQVLLELTLVRRSETVELVGRGCPWLQRIGAGDTVDFGVKGAFGSHNINIERKWLDVEVVETRMRVEMTAKNAFDEVSRFETAWETIPNPDTRAPFRVSWSPKR